MPSYLKQLSCFSEQMNMNMDTSEVTCIYRLKYW